MLEIRIDTARREEFVDITLQVAEAARGLGDGALMLFCPHTTCGLTINEGADPDVRRDLLAFLTQTAPREGWRHAEGNSDAHIKASLLGSSLLVPLEGGRPRLGRWQSIYLYEGDGPRRRTLWLAPLVATK